jgi:tRNA pseudouridine55 synthase
MSTDGGLVVDKPAGPTSHDVVDRVRQAFGTRRAGHTGTLDPFATGVLVVCVGKATRLARFLAEGEKVYRATVRLGFATTTDDLLGEPLAPPRAVDVERGAVEQACRQLAGRQLQVPPAFSAKRRGGVRLYELARRGAAVVADPFPVNISAIEVLDCAADRVELVVTCSPGTYIRALARDLGERLNVGGHLVALRRTRSGSFGVEDAVAWEALESRAPGRLRPLSDLLPDMPAVRVGEEGTRALRHGRDLVRHLVVSGFPQEAAGFMRVLDESGRLLALAVPRGFQPERGALPISPALHPDVVLLD